MSKMIKDYRIKKLLGKGTYALAFLVEKTTLDSTKNYVIKQISLENLSPSEKEEVKQEANLLSQIKSDFVVKYFDSFEENNCLNIVMEYCEGGDLEHLLKQRNKIPLNDNFIWKLFIQIVIGLAELHNMKILHRDLKTSNIFLTNNYNIKIGDLGVAKKLSNNNDFTKTLIGTPFYLSPEICKEKPYNEKSDIWALGCILYELCTFKHPFETTNQAALVNKILKENPKPIPYTFDFYFNEIIKKLLQKNMNKRPSCKLILKDMYVVRKAKELKLYHLYLNLIGYKNSSSKAKNNKQNLKISIDDNNNKHIEKNKSFTINTIGIHSNISTKPRSCSKNQKTGNNILNDSKKIKFKKNGIPFSKRNPFSNEKENSINIKQVKPEINKSITNRKKSSNKSLKKENKKINKTNQSKTKNKNNLNIYLVDTLEINKNRFNKSDNKMKNDPCNKENYNTNNIQANISHNEIKFNEERSQTHANIYNNQNEMKKMTSSPEEKYSLNELINDFQSPKENNILSKLNNNFSNNKENSNDKNSNLKNDKNIGTSAFHIYYNKNNINSEKGDNYLSDSDDEKYSINQKEEKSENEDNFEEERVKTILNDVPDSYNKINNNKLNSLLAEKTKKNFFKIIEDEEYSNIN